MVRRVLIAVALGASVAVVAVAVVELTGQRARRPPASRADVYTRLAQQLKGHLQPLVPTKATTKQAPTFHVPAQQGYSCEVASTTGCSLHPCVKYAFDQTGVVVDNAVPTISSAGSSGCRKTANATPRAIPIATP